MVEIIELENTLPSPTEYLINDRFTRKSRELLLKDVLTTIREALESRSEPAKRFKGTVYVGFDWVFASMNNALRNMSLVESAVIEALREVEIIEKSCKALAFPVPLRLHINPKRPRTVIYIASDQDELYCAGEIHA